MKMLLLVDILNLMALALGTGVLLTATARRSHTWPALLLFVGLCVEIVCAYASSAWLRGPEWAEWEVYARLAGRSVELVVVANFIRYLLSAGGGQHRTELPERPA